MSKKKKKKREVPHVSGYHSSFLDQLAPPVVGSLHNYGVLVCGL
jgi:hypothetical protein